MTPAFEPLGYWLEDYYALATCVLLAVGPVLLALRQPARRLAVCWCALAGLLSLLIFSLLPFWPRVDLVGLRPSVRQGIPSLNAAEAPASPKVAARRLDESREGLAESPVRPSSVGEGRGRGEPPAFSISDGGRVAQTVASPLTWRSLVIRAFPVGAGLMLAWLAIGAWQLAVLRRRSERASQGATDVLARVVGKDATAPELLVSDSLAQPVAVGVLRPTIILPRRFLEEPENRLEAALAHEWGHLRNGDLRLIAVSRLLLPILFAHPMYWWLRRRIRDDQETLADASAAAVEGRLRYAEVLLSWSKSVPKRSWSAAGGAVALFERPSQIKRRIVMLLDGDFRVETTCPTRWRLAVRVATATAVMGISFLTLRPTAVGADGSEKPVQTSGDATAAAKPESTEKPEGSGLLLDPDGKPFAGAKVYLSAPGLGLEGGPTTPTLLGETGPDGSFRHPQQIGRPTEPRGEVVVTAEGYGPAFADSLRRGVGIFRLVKDDVPIRGRVLDIQGRPVAGATVGVVGILWHPSGQLNEWLEALKTEKSAYEMQYKMLRWWASDDVPYFFPPVVADQEGRFTIQGVGRERVASLLVSGPGVETTFEYVATREMPTIKVPDFPRQNFSHEIVYYGADFDLVVGPELVAVGTVTDKDSGEPLAGATVGTTSLFGNPLRTLKTTTDAQGRYRLAGIPPKTNLNDEQDLIVNLADGLPYLPTVKHLGKGDGEKPIVIDLQLKRGVRAKGRVFDKTTGKGVRTQLSYYILSENPNLKSYPRYGTIRAAMPYSTDDEGNFELIVMPGPGVIGARAGNEHYRLGAGVESIEGMKWTDEKRHFVAAEPSYLMPSNYHTVFGIHPKPGDESVACDIGLDRGRSVKGRVVGPDGEPLAGARIEGLQDYFRTWSHKPLPSAEFVVEGIGEGASRDLLVYHEGKKLAGAYVIGADEGGPITVKLEPCGTAIGRLVDVGGLPMAEVEMTTKIPYNDPKHEAGSLPGVVKTDGDGRFRAEGFVPGRKYSFRAWIRDRDMNMVVIAAKDVVVASGETKDLGDVILGADE